MLHVMSVSDNLITAHLADSDRRAQIGHPIAAPAAMRNLKNRQARRISFFGRKWKNSKKGNEYLKIDDHVIVLYHNTKNADHWKYAIDNQFCRNAYATRERAVAGAFEAMERFRSKG